MTKETLLEWGLAEEQADRVMEGLNGSFVTKSRFNEINAELKQAREAVAEKDTRLEELERAAGEAEALKNQIAGLQAANDAKEQEHAAELKAARINNAVEVALLSAGAKNNMAVKALLNDFIAKAELAEDGTVKGLEEEVKGLAEAGDTAFLFHSAAEKRFQGARAAEKGGPGREGEMTLARFHQLSPGERYDFSVNHPEEYTQLYGGKESWQM